MRIALALFLLSFSASASLPPTSTRGSAGGNYNTTFKFDFPYIPITQSGTLATFGQIPLGTGVSGNLPLANIAQIADGTVLSNISGGSAVPAANTMTSILDDAFGSAQGSILYRNATVWTVLNPGTNGEFLKTQGAAADPDWDTPTDTGITQLTGDVTAGPGNGSQAATIANDAVTDAKLRESAAVSVIGRSANSTGNPADIAAGANGNILRRSGDAVAFGAIDLADSDAVAATILGVANGGTGLATLTANNVILGAGSSTPTFVAPGTSGNVLTSNGTTWTSAASTAGNVSTVTGAGRIVSARLDAPSAGTCAVAIENGGDWIDGTPTSAGTGRCAITFNSGVFSASVAPQCFCSGAAGAGSVRLCQAQSFPTTTEYEQIVVDGSGTAQTSDRTVICFGLQP